MVTSSKYGRAYRPAGEISDEEVNKIVEKNWSGQKGIPSVSLTCRSAQHLAEQKYTLDNLVAYAESMADDPNVSATIAQFNPLVGFIL